MAGAAPAGEVTDRLAAASAHLRLVAPPEAEAYMVEAEGVTKRHRPGDEEWMEEWRALRKRMRHGFSEALDGSSASAE